MSRLPPFDYFSLKLIFTKLFIIIELFPCVLDTYFYDSTFDHPLGRVEVERESVILAFVHVGHSVLVPPLCGGDGGL